jgi:DNA modification methylase
MEINRIYNEDCINTMQKINEKIFNAIITSPPYNTSRKGSSLLSPSANVRYDDFNDCKSDNEYIEGGDSSIAHVDEISEDQIEPPMVEEIEIPIKNRGIQIEENNLFPVNSNKKIDLSGKVNINPLLL